MLLWKCNVEKRDIKKSIENTETIHAVKGRSCEKEKELFRCNLLLSIHSNLLHKRNNYIITSVKSFQNKQTKEKLQVQSENIYISYTSFGWRVRVFFSYVYSIKWFEVNEEEKNKETTVNTFNTFAYSVVAHCRVWFTKQLFVQVSVVVLNKKKKNNNGITTKQIPFKLAVKLDFDFERSLCTRALKNCNMEKCKCLLDVIVMCAFFFFQEWKGPCVILPFWNDAEVQSIVVKTD